jgi:uncharacterized protein (UPF0218 family)
VPTLVLTDAQKRLLKQPLGELIAGTPADCNRVLNEIVTKEKPTRLILVGDTVSRNAIQMRMRPDVIIVDNLEKREKAVQFDYSAEHIFRTQNRAGTIESGTWQIIDEAVRQGNSVVLVDGEEDLLTLPAILSSPDKSIVVYGQPSVGIVIVRVTPEKKKDITKLVEQMEKKS